MDCPGEAGGASIMLVARIRKGRTRWGDKRGVIGAILELLFDELPFVLADHVEALIDLDVYHVRLRPQGRAPDVETI